MSKVNKSEVIRDVLKTMTAPYELMKVVAAAQARINQLPPEQRKGVVVHRHDVRDTIVRTQSLQKNGTVTVAASRPGPDAADNAYTPGELLAARSLLMACGESLVRAGNALKLIASLTIARHLLSDRDWVCAPEGGGGDENRAIDRLEQICFGDLCGALSLPELLDLLQAVPQESTWKKNRYNLRQMHAEMMARRKSRQPSTPPNPRSPSTPEEVIRDLRQKLSQRDQEIAELKKENRSLKKAVQGLQSAVQSLQVA